MLYDIRDEKKAALTLEYLTGVQTKHWLIEKKYNRNRNDYTDDDKDIERIVRENNGHFPNLEDFNLVVTHITTSSDKCLSIKKNGIIDLKKSYSLLTSDLRKFLDMNGIEILVDSCQLKYKGKIYDISYKDCPYNSRSKEYASWLVGRKFYYDFTVCGFISINQRDVYGGCVHERPEILYNIDNLLDTDLQIKWINEHEPYEVIFQIPVKDTIYDGYGEESEYEKVMSYLTRAYECICFGPRTIEILCKDNVDILPKQILECNKFEKWNR